MAAEFRCNAALYVHESVWDSAAKVVRESTVHQMLQESHTVTDPQQQEPEWPYQPQLPSSSSQQQQQHASAAVAAASGDSKQQSASASDYLVLM